MTLSHSSVMCAHVSVRTHTHVQTHMPTNMHVCVCVCVLVHGTSRGPEYFIDKVRTFCDMRT